jgi:hypothetical protein
MLMRFCTEQVELWWVIYGSFSPFSAVQDMNERQDFASIRGTPATYSSRPLYERPLLLYFEV